MSKKNCLRKRRYEYYKGTTEIMDNEANKLVEDVIDVLNQKDYNIIELLKIKQFQEQRIAELEEQLENAIVPKFNRQEHIYCVAFGEIREFVVVAYLDNNITLCEDTTTSKLEWCDNEFLVLTKEEAEAKLKELKKRGKNEKNA